MKIIKERTPETIKEHYIEFRYLLLRDRNRADDGIDMRRRFILAKNYDHMYNVVMRYLNGPCSVLEMILALAIRCEEAIMDDPKYGDRTNQWFWMMITNLGLGSMTDANFDRDYVDNVIDTFLSRKYKPDGTGGLFVIKRCERDLRDVEIWHQLNWYLDTII
jgi:hypothetical protein